MANVNPVSLLSVLPADLQSQLAREQEARQIANALLLSGLGPQHNEMLQAGGVGTADFGQLGKPFQVLAARRMLDQAAGNEAGISDEYQKRMAKELAQLYGGMLPTMEPTDTGGAPYKETPADPRKLLVRMMASQMPEIRALAQKRFEQFNIDTAEVLKAAGTGNVSGPSLAQFVANPNDPGVLKAPPKIHISDTAVVEAEPGGTPRILPTQTYRREVEPTSGVSGNVSNLTNKFEGITGGNLTPTTRFQVNADEARVKKMEAGSKQYQDDIETLRAVAQVQNAMLNIPADKFGSLAGIRNELNKFIGVLAGKQDPATVNMEKVIAGTGQQMLANIRLLAPVTEYDVSMLQKIVGGAQNTKQALEGMMEYLAQSRMDRMGSFEKFMQGLEEKPGGQGLYADFVPGFAVGEGAPAAPAQKNYKEMSDEEIRAELEKVRKARGK